MSIKPLITQAVILAGGKGVRLRPLTNDRPKPMVEVNGHPFLEYLVSMLKKNGIEEIILLLGYLPENVTDYFGDGQKFGVRIEYSIKPIDYNNGTRLREAQSLLDERFILLYGDTYWPMDLLKMSGTYLKLGKPAMMTVYSNKRSDGEFGHKNSLEISPNGTVKQYVDLTEDTNIQGLDIGFCILDKSLLQLMPQEDFEFQRGFLVPLIKNRQVSAFITETPYVTITNPELLKKAGDYFRVISQDKPPA